MRHRSASRSVALLFLTAAGATSPPALAQAGDGAVEEVRQVLESLPQYAVAGDLGAIGGLYAPGRGVHIIEGAGVNHGWEDYRDHHLAPELENFENFEYRYFAIEPVIRGDVAYSAFRYELAADTPSGHVEMEGRGTAVLDRMDDDWRIVHMHTSGRRK